MIHYTSERILKGLLERDKGVIEYIYNDIFPSVKFMVIRNSGNYQDADDIFQDALIAVYNKIKNKDLTLTCTFKTYLYSVCRRLWLHKLEGKRVRRKKFKDFENYIILQNNDNEEIAYEEAREKYKLYQLHFLELSVKCQKILRLFLNNNTIKEITEIMGYKTENYTRTRKYLCKEILKKQIMNDPKCKKYLKK